ncbi:hypothetical protein D3C87_1230950 [compost metagenome]
MDLDDHAAIVVGDVEEGAQRRAVTVEGIDLELGAELAQAVERDGDGAAPGSDGHLDADRRFGRSADHGGRNLVVKLHNHVARLIEAVAQDQDLVADRAGLGAEAGDEVALVHGHEGAGVRIEGEEVNRIAILVDRRLDDRVDGVELGAGKSDDLLVGIRGERTDEVPSLGEELLLELDGERQGRGLPAEEDRAGVGVVGADPARGGRQVVEEGAETDSVRSRLVVGITGRGMRPPLANALDGLEDVEAIGDGDEARVEGHDEVAVGVGDRRGGRVARLPVDEGDGRALGEFLVIRLDLARGAQSARQGGDRRRRRHAGGRRRHRGQAAGRQEEDKRQQDHGRHAHGSSPHSSGATRPTLRSPW